MTSKPLYVRCAAYALAEVYVRACDTLLHLCLTTSQQHQCFYAHMAVAALQARCCGSRYAQSIRGSIPRKWQGLGKLHAAQITDAVGSALWQHLMIWMRICFIYTTVL